MTCEQIFTGPISSLASRQRTTCPGSRKGRINSATAPMMAALVITLLSALFCLSAGQTPAFASCATDKPARSPAAFTGVVTSTKSHGRIATVRTDTGATVKVVGTPDTGSGATSVDRTYEVGGRYEFHPTNDASPFQDNACTATRLLSMTSPPPTTTSGLQGSPMKVAALTALLVGGVTAAVAVSRRTSR